MYLSAQIDKTFVPYTKRRVFRQNAGLFVDGTASRGSGGILVTLQSADCAGKANGTPCGSYAGMYCCDGECKFGPDC